MIKEFSIGIYRGLKNLQLNNLRNINILVGPNNCGKTSVLEAIIFSGLFDDIDLLVDALVSRYHGFSTQHFKSLFPINHEPVICIKTQLDNDEDMLHTHLTYNQSQLISKDEAARISNMFELSFSYGYSDATAQNSFFVRFEEEATKYKIGIGKSPNNVLKFHIPCKFISFSRFDHSEQLTNDIDKLLDQNLRQELIDILQIFDEKITNFEILGKERTIKLFKGNDDAPLTLHDYGNGMYKAFYIATSALLAKDGILLIDEIEAGIHSKALKSFIQKLVKVCSLNNVQMFLTTHSLEAIDIVLEDCFDMLDDIAVYHIKNKENTSSARRYSGTKLLNLRNEIGFDVR